MSHDCHSEHSHAHSHGSHSTHDHSDDLTPASQTLLYPYIDFASIRTLNESVPHSGRAIVQKDWSARLSPSPSLRSADGDAQLLLHVAFTGQVRLHSVLVRSADAPGAPRTLHLYANDEALDFGAVEGGAARPTQTLELARTGEVQELPVKRALFGQVRCLALFVEDNFAGSSDDDEETLLSWLAFKGDFMRLSREPVNVLYEAAARPSDHKIEGVGASGGMTFEGAARRGF